MSSKWKQTTVQTCKEIQSEIATILALGYLRYHKERKSTNESKDKPNAYMPLNNMHNSPKNNLIIRPTNALVRTSVNKRREGKRTKKPKKPKRSKNDQRTFK